MISSLDSSAQSFLAGLNQIQLRAQAAQQQLTTGLKINSVSDAPDQIAALLQVRSDLARTQQIDTNLGSVKTEVDAGESALESAVSLVENAQTLGSQGTTGTADAQTRQEIAGQLGTLLQQLVSSANTQVAGRYIFSGDSDQQPAYTIDLTQTPPISAYLGSGATRQIESTDGSQFAVARNAQTIFDGPNAQQSVFTSINNLRVALLNNDQAGAAAALNDVHSAGTYLNTQLAFYGTVQDRIASASDAAKTNETQLKIQLSGIQDADEAASITEFTQAQTQLQAALTSRSLLSRKSLFDYLA